MLSPRGSAVSRTLSVIVALALAATLAPAMGAFAAQAPSNPGPTPPSAAIPRVWDNPSNARSDNQIPGRIFHASPTSGSLSALSDPQDVFAVELEEGQRVYFRTITTAGSLQARMRLYSPEATSTASSSPLLTIPDVGLAGRLIYQVPAGKGGRYYLAVYAYSGFGDYKVFGPEENDSIPGTLLATPEDGILDVAGSGATDGDVIDVYKVRLTNARWYEFNVTRTANVGDFQFALYQPGKVDPTGVDTVGTAIGQRSKSLRYLATATSDYYLVVKWTAGSGDYRLTQPGSPFGMMAYSYNFGNFGGQADEPLFRSVFGLPAEPLSLVEKMFYRGTFYNAYGGGQCYGMAVTAGMFYRGAYGARPGNFTQGAQYARDIVQYTRDNQLDEGIERHISKFHYYQADPTIKDTRRGFGPGLQNGRWLDLMMAHAGGWKDPYILSFRGRRANDSTWGHATNITGLQWEYSDGEVYTSMYDNNVPNSLSHFVTNGVDFAAGKYADVYSANIRPTSPHERDSIPKLWGPLSRAAVSYVYKNNAIVLHTDRYGRRLGTLDGREIAEIPGGERVEWITGNINPDWIEPIEYYLPPNADYDVEVHNAKGGEIAYDLFDGDQALHLQVPQSAPRTSWTLATDLDRHGVLLSAASVMPESAALTLAREPGDTSRMIEVSGIALGGRPDDPTGGAGVGGAPSALHLTSDPSADTFALAFNGAPQTCDLKLSGMVGRTTLETRIEGFDATADSSHTIEVWDWRKLPTSPIFITGYLADGTEEVVAYQATAENFGAMVAEMKSQGLIGSELAAEIVRLRSKGVGHGVLGEALDSAVARGDSTRGAAAKILAAAKALDE